MKKTNVIVPISKPINFVAKHSRTFNKATVEVDRKKKSDRMTDRKMKHKTDNMGY